MDQHDLLKTKGCLNCHHVERKLVGPAFKDVKNELIKTSNSKQRFEESVKEGSKGKWGAIPMPANPTLTPSEINTLYNWIMSLK